MAPSLPRVEQALTLERLADVHRASAEIARRTPVLSSASLSERCGGTIALKAECLQRTGSFKLRGALNKLRTIGDGAGGVVAGSAGNHGQSVAYAARHAGLPCEIFMPEDAAVSKVAAVQAFGARVHQMGGSVDDCVALARARSQEAGFTFVHPFDDHDVIAVQAGLGIELVEDVPDLAKVLVPIGGGGLASGVALAVKLARPEVEVIGVQARECAPVLASLERGEVVAQTRASHTIADGIAIKRPGEITLPLLRRWVDDVVAVGEDAIAEAMTLLLERSKLLVEGAGAATVAALLHGDATPAASGTTVAIVSGGNVDLGLIGSIAAYAESRTGRRARLFTRVSDRPGGLAGLLTAVAAAHANLIAVEHARDGVERGVRETGVVLTVETTGPDHLDRLLAALRADGYAVAAEEHPDLQTTPGV